MGERSAEAFALHESRALAVRAPLSEESFTMKNFYRPACAAALSIALLLTSRSAHAQLPTDPVERAKVIAQIFQVNARQLTLFDREGKEVGLIGRRDMYNQPVLSPDAKRVAVAKTDIDKETQDVWVLDVATGAGMQLTTSQKREGSNSPVWSPDGSQVA